MKKSLLIAIASMLFVISSGRAQAPLWEQTNGPSGRWITAINFDSSGNVYIIATNDNGIASDHLYRSGDNGATWQVMPQAPFALSTLPNGDILATFDSSIRISKDHGATWISILPNRTLDYPYATGTTAGDIFVPGNEMLRSSDEGGHWDTLPPAPIVGDFSSYYTTTLFLSGDGNAYRSTDRGESWTKIVNGVVHRIYPIDGGINGKMWAEIDGAAGWSTDDGRTWSQSTKIADDDGWATFTKNGFAVTPDQKQSIDLYDQNGKFTKSISSGLFSLKTNRDGPSAMSASPNGEIWLAEGPTLFKINPNSESTFTNVSLPTGGVKFIVATASGSIIASSGILSNPRVAFGNTDPADLLLYSSNDGGKTWNAIFGSDYLSPFAMDSDKALLAGMISIDQYGTSSTVIVSTNNGMAWAQLGSPLTTTTITSIVVDAPGNIYMGCGEGVFRSTDKGATWDQLNSGITDFNIQSLAVSKTGEIFAGSPTAIFHSTDLALDWKALPFTPPDTSGIFLLTINTAGDLLAAVHDTGIFWSHDDGKSWSSIGTGLSGKVNAMLSTPSGHVFAGTTEGIFYLASGGGTWVDATPGLGTVSVLSITRDPSGTVYLGTDGEGVFRSTQTYNSIKGAGVNQAVASVTNLSLGQAYPNPMQNSGAVTIGIPEASTVRVELLNTLGERVKLITDRQFDAGSYSLSLDTHGLPNGVYFLMLTTAGAVKAEKVTIAR
jgi:photosystem II stability/assembly factor-like uncharacterized protein